MQTARLNLGFTKVRSLVDGIAAIATAQVGDQVAPSTLLTTVSQVHPIRAYFSLSEDEYLRVASQVNRAVTEGPLEHRAGAAPEVDRRNGLSEDRSVSRRRSADRPDDRHHSHQCDVPQSGSRAAARPVWARASGHDRGAGCAPGAAARGERAAGHVAGSRRRAGQQGGGEDRHPRSAVWRRWIVRTGSSLAPA